MAEYIERETAIEIIMSEPTDAHYPSWYAEKIKEIHASNVEPVRNWISVTERLPDDAETVLTYKNGIIEVQVYEKMRNGWINGNWFWSMATVTHWMPLPDPPEGAMKKDHNQGKEHDYGNQ